MYAYILRKPGKAQVYFSEQPEHAENAIWVPIQDESGIDFVTRLVHAAQEHFDDRSYRHFLSPAGGLYLIHR